VERPSVPVRLFSNRGRMTEHVDLGLEVATQSDGATEVDLLTEIRELLGRLSDEPATIRLDLDQFQQRVALVRERAECPD